MKIIPNRGTSPRPMATCSQEGRVLRHPAAAAIVVTRTADIRHRIVDQMVMAVVVLRF